MSHSCFNNSNSGRHANSSIHLARIASMFCVVIALAVSNTAMAEKPNCPDHPSCKPDEPSDSGLFGVEIDGDLQGLGIDWRQESGQNQVLYNHFWEDGSDGVLTDLSFFRGLFAAGDVCFPADDVPLFSSILKKAKKDSAKAVIWFDGWTNDNSKQVLYRLDLTGSFASDKDFPPTNTNTMIMTIWSLSVENEGKTVKGKSCIGEGDSGDGSGFGVSIDVIRQP